MSTIIVGDFFTPLSVIARKNTVENHVVDLNIIINQTDLWSILPNNSRIHILLKFTWNIHKID